MAAGGGWRPLRAPSRSPAQIRLSASPFARLGVTHVLSVAGDTLVTMALAGSLFFSIDPNAARTRIALYLLLTMAPFAVVAPLVGPALDRSRRGRRAVLTASMAGRALVCLVMARHLDGLLLFPEAFAVLVLSKVYLVTKSALVPTTVDDPDELVEANSRLALLGVVAGFVAAGPGALTLNVGALGAPWTMRLAAVAFAAATLASLRLHRAALPEQAPAEPALQSELRASSILLSATAMAVLRGAVGFFTFLVAFSFRRADAPSWWFGAMLAASLVGSFLGAAVAPWLRRAVSEERIVAGCLLVLAGVCLVVSRGPGLLALGVLSAVIGASAGAAKLAFDSIVQRDAPDVARGRAFARFETRFQLAWVAGAAVPVILPIPSEEGVGILAVAAAFAWFTYVGGGRVTSRRRSR